MNRKYTTGPWLLSTIDGEDTLMVGGGDGSDVVADIRTDRKEFEVEANAHLIASAPELYEALKALYSEVCTFRHLASPKDEYDYRDRLMDRAAAAKVAIDHAEGRDATNE
jgi:hypothetical protein